METEERREGFPQEGGGREGAFFRWRRGRQTFSPDGENLFPGEDRRGKRFSPEGDYELFSLRNAE